MIGMTISPTKEVYKRSERDPDNHANGEIDHVTAHGKFLEFVEHGEPPSLADLARWRSSLVPSRESR